MKTIKIKNPYNTHLETRAGDVDIIIRVLDYYGYCATPDQAVLLWELYSESLAAGWLGLPSDNDELFECIKPYFERSTSTPIATSKRLSEGPTKKGGQNNPPKSPRPSNKTLAVEATAWDYGFLNPHNWTNAPEAIPNRIKEKPKLSAKDVLVQQLRKKIESLYEENNRFLADICDKDEAIISLREENKRLKSMYENEKDSNIDQFGQPTVSYNPGERLLKEVNILTAACNKLREENKTLKTKIEHLSSDKPGTIRARFNGLAKYAEEELGHCKYSSQGFEGTIRKTISSLKEENEILKISLEQLKEHLKHLRSDNPGSYKAVINNLQARLETEENTNEGLEIELDASNREIIIQTTINKSLEEKNKSQEKLIRNIRFAAKAYPDSDIV